MNYLQKKSNIKLTEYYPKLVRFFQVSKLSNCNENHPDFAQKHDRKSVTSEMAACFIQHPPEKSCLVYNFANYLDVYR